MGTLDGKVAIVTGASSGIGEATAFELSKQGARVTLVARRKDRLEALAEKIHNETGNEVTFVAGDVTDYKTAETAVDAAKAKWQRLDILINNAGVMYLGPVCGANVDDWRRMLDINVLGLMYFSHAAIPAMKLHGNGHIVNISSVSGRLVSARSAVYSASKFAVNAFSDGLRQELAKDRIRVTVVLPGAVLTELADHIPDRATKDSVKSWVATMDALKSEDIAASIAYACSQPSNVNVNEILIRPTDQTF